ncbi:MAG: carboxypeptidase-like regulatory domain-containing protein [Saprospiraceae bacterium]
MSDVFETLRTKYQLTIAYDYGAVKNIEVNKTIRSKDLETALTTLFKNTNLEFQLTEDKRILVRKVQTSALSKTATPITNQYTFTGKITDIKSKTPLAFATIYCPLTNKGVSTDEDGNFSLTVSSPKTEGTISIQYLGYIPRAFAWKKGEDLSNLQIDLQIKSLDFAEITIIEKLPTFTVNQTDGSMVLNAKQLNNLPSFGGGNDVFRGLQLLPGISASDDLSAELKIRGSDGDENMVIFDGITLYKIDHFYGVFSAINPSIVNQVKVFKNAFPVEYGGRTAGVIDLASHGISEPKIGGQLQADLLTSSAHLALPINEKMGILIGGRTTNKNVADTDLFSLINTADDLKNDNALTLSKINPAFKFYDFNAKWIWQLSQQSTISVSYFKGYDELNSIYEIFFETKNNKDNRKYEVKNTETLNEFAKWNNQGASLQLNHQWNPKINTNINLAYSAYEEQQAINSTLIRAITRKPRPGFPSLPPESLTDTLLELNLNNGFSNSIKGTELNIKNRWSISNKQQLTFGYHLIHNQVTSDLTVDNKKPLSQDLTGSQHSSYLQYNLSGFNKLSLGLGLRNTYYTVTQKNYLSPRISLTYEASERLHLKASCSQYYQFLRTNEREDRFGKNYDYWVLSTDKRGESPVASSKQCMLGLNLKNDGFELDIEAYYKNLDGVTEFAPTANGFLTGDVNTSSNKLFEFYNGTGVSKGIDVLLKKNAGNYTGWLSYTLSKTTHSFPKIDNGNPFPSLDDRRHQVKLVNQYRYKKFDFSAVYIFSSGRAYTDLTIINGQQDRKDLKVNERISYLKDYARLDISAGYKFNIGSTKARIGASIFNVLNRENVKYKQFIRSIPNEKGDNNQEINQITGIEALMLGFTPNVSFSLAF